MLNIGLMAAGQQTYYLSIASGVEDYYTGRGEAPGRWLGAGAEILGLAGMVDEADLTAVLEGRAPGSDDRLTRAKLPGLDFTFRAPKSISILYGLGEAGTVTGEVVAAHEAAVDAAVGYLERQVCLSRRRTDGVQHQVPGDGFVAAGFRHQTSRAGDPTLHTHVLIANMTRMPDGRWGALHSPPMFHHAKTAGFLYQAQLRCELTRRLGVEWEPVTNGYADVAGIPRELIDEFSTRRAEILDAMEARAEHSAKAAQNAALDTRRAKVYDVDATTLRADWALRADELGFGPVEVAELIERGVTREPQLWSVGDLFDDLASPSGVTEHASTFGRRDVVRAVAERMGDGADVTAIEDLADGFIAEHRVIEVGDVAGEPRWTTVELLLTENRVVERTRNQRDAGAAIAQPDKVEAAIASRPSISDEQAAMVRHLTLSGAGIDVAVGAAGTGKTFTFDAAREGWEASGYSVFGAALSARAAAELSAGSGIPAMTITRLLNQLDEGRLQLDAGCVVVIDESGMVGTRTLDAISRHTTEAGAKLVLAGDTAQLPEIDAGGSFRAMSIYAPSTTLVENRRQIHEWEIGALDDLRNGRVSEAVAAYGNNGRIITADNADALRQRLVDDWFNAPGTDKVMIATRRADVADLNDRARTLLDAAGRFGNHELHIDKRIQVAGREFAVGDQVLATGRNHWDLDILNGDIGTVTAINERNRTVTFHCERVDAERTMPTDRLEAGFLDHGYARTNYKTQGATADRIFTLGGDGDLDRQAAYTALSRGRVENRLYMSTPDEDVWEILAPNPQRAQRVEGRELLLEHAERELSRDRSQHLASELLANLPEPDGTPVGHSAADLLDQLPEPVGRRAHATMAGDLLADLPEPDVVDEDLAERVAKVTARLDRLQHRQPPAVDDGFGIGL
jgi:conjugative relaxase-like TrwC/TraI family protein